MFVDFSFLHHLPSGENVLFDLCYFEAIALLLGWICINTYLYFIPHPQCKLYLMSPPHSPSTTCKTILPTFSQFSTITHCNPLDRYHCTICTLSSSSKPVLCIYIARIQVANWLIVYCKQSKQFFEVFIQLIHV